MWYYAPAPMPHDSPDDLFAADGPPALHRIRWVWAVYSVLFAVSIPWYVPADAPPRIWLGMPHWVAISLGAVLAIALFTAVVVPRYWNDRQ